MQPKLIIIPESSLVRGIKVRLILIIILTLIIVTPLRTQAPELPEPKQELFLAQYELALQKDIIEYYRSANSKELTITAYTAREEETNEDPRNTALMEEPIPGYTVAVSQDLKRWLGKRIYIQGLGVFRVNDLMNKRFTNRVDILVHSVRKAREFGKQQRKVVLVYEPTNK